MKQLREAQKDLDALKNLSTTQDPTEIRCPMCRHKGKTVVETINGPSTYLACGGLTPIAGCCIPFFGKKFKEVFHRCPACNHALGKCTYSSARPGKWPKFL